MLRVRRLHKASGATGVFDVGDVWLRVPFDGRPISRTVGPGFAIMVLLSEERDRGGVLDAGVG